MKIGIKLMTVLAVLLAINISGAAAIAGMMGGDGNSGGTSSASGESRLWVFGNANQDDRIDETDIDYLNGVLDGTYEENRLCDANNDGVVDSKDADYISRIIAAAENGTDEITVWYIDSYLKVASVDWPVNSIAIGYCSGAYAADIAHLCSKVTMVDNTIKNYWSGMNSHFASAESFGTTEDPDTEAMMKAGIDVYVVGYCDEDADQLTPSKLNPAGIDVMFLTTADNSGIDEPNEYIDRSFLMFAYLLQGDMDNAYAYLAWHDRVLSALEDAGSSVTDDEKASFVMARSSFQYQKSTISVTGYNNTNNIHAEWVGVYAAGQHSSVLSKNYNSLTEEQVLEVVSSEKSASGYIYYMDNEHDGMRQQHTLEECLAADAEMLSEADAYVHLLGMAREAGNSPMYVVELAFYQNVMYPELYSGVNWKSLFWEYFTFSEEDYTSIIDIDRFFYDYGVVTKA